MTIEERSICIDYMKHGKVYVSYLGIEQCSCGIGIVSEDKKTIDGIHRFSAQEEHRVICHDGEVHYEFLKSALFWNETKNTTNYEEKYFFSLILESVKSLSFYLLFEIYYQLFFDSMNIINSIVSICDDRKKYIDEINLNISSSFSQKDRNGDYIIDGVDFHLRTPLKSISFTINTDRKIESAHKWEMGQGGKEIELEENNINTDDLLPHIIWLIS